MITVFKKVLLTAICMLFVQSVCAEDKTSGSTNNLTANDATVTVSEEATPAQVAEALTSQKFLLTYKVNGRVYYQRSVPFGTIIKAIDAPIKEGFVFSGWTGAPATMPAQNIEINGSLVAANEATKQPVQQTELLAKK